MNGDENRLAVEVTPRCQARMVLYHGNVPGIAIDYGGYELVLTAGPDRRSALVAKEFAIGVAYAALCFVDACHRTMPTRAE